MLASAVLTGVALAGVATVWMDVEMLTAMTAAAADADAGAAHAAAAAAARRSFSSSSDG